MSEIAIKVTNVSKSFKLPHEKHNSIKGLFLSLFKARRTYEKQRVLKDVTFEVNRGEFFGIVGRNGSGKSTILKLLAGIYTPDKGQIEVNGKLTPFIELGVGFNPELTGRENVFLNGALLGFDRKEIQKMYDEIVEFAELAQFMDQKLKNYSSGMQVRLAFSIAIKANTDILVLDEVLAVGDAAFQEKCYEYFNKLKQGGKTVILVTHDMSSVERFCTRALIIENGNIKSIGKPARITKQYTLDNMNAGHSGSVDASDGSKRKLNNQVQALDVKLLSGQTLTINDELKLEVSYMLNEPLKVDIGISLSSRNQSVIEQNTQGLKLKHSTGIRHKLIYKHTLHNLNPGIYEVAVAIFDAKNFKLIGFNTDTCKFIIEGKNQGGLLASQGEWQVDDKS